MTDHASPEIARLRQAFAALADEAATADCPDPERIWDAANGQSTPEATAAIVDHLATCGACAEAWRLAVALPGREVAGPREAATAPGDGAAPLDDLASRRGGLAPSSRSRRSMYLAAASAALALAAAVAIYVGVIGRSAKPEWRGTDEPDVRLLVPDGAVLDRDAFVLRWEPAGAGARYTVTLTTEALVSVTTVDDLEATSLRVPAATLAAFGPGTGLVWRVDATLPDRTRLRSPTRRVSVR